AHQFRLTVDLRRARPALPRLAVPAHRDIVCLDSLNSVHRVQHHHSGFDFGEVVDKLALAVRAAPDAEGCLHLHYLFSSTTCCISDSTRTIPTRFCMKS